MQISAADWNRYINRLAKVNEAAANQMREYIRRHGTDNVDALIQMANAIATKYGEAAAAVTCDMYDAIAEAQGAELAPAVPAMTPSIEETGNVVRSAMRRAPAILADEIGKLVKKTSTRTMRKNAARDDALMALVPCGDGCPFCKMLGSRGWEPARASKSFEAHLHSNCRCEYVVRFGDDLEVEGYDPDALYEEFQQYEGSWDEKMKAMRREQGGQNRETISTKKRLKTTLRKDNNADNPGLRASYDRRNGTFHPVSSGESSIKKRKNTDIKETGNVQLNSNSLTIKSDSDNNDEDAIINYIKQVLIPKQNTQSIVPRQEIHRQGTKLFLEREKMLAAKGEFGPGYITISDEEIIELVNKFKGSGEVRYNSKGEWNHQEIILDNDIIVGVVVDNRNGNSAETSVFKIHYAKDGIHISPDYPSKKKRRAK